MAWLSAAEDNISVPSRLIHLTLVFHRTCQRAGFTAWRRTVEGPKAGLTDTGLSLPWWRDTKSVCLQVKLYQGDQLICCAIYPPGLTDGGTRPAAAEAGAMPGKGRPYPRAHGKGKR